MVVDLVQPAKKPCVPLGADNHIGGCGGCRRRSQHSFCHAAVYGQRYDTSTTRFQSSPTQVDLGDLTAASWWKPMVILKTRGH